MIYGIFYVFCVVLILYESFLFRTLKKQTDSFDRSVEIAADAAVQSFKKAVYEDGVLVMTESVFDIVCSAVSGEEEKVLKSIGVSINGKIMENSAELGEVKRGDRIELTFVFLPQKLTAPGRKAVYEKTLNRAVTID